MPRLILVQGTLTRFCEFEGRKVTIGAHPKNPLVVEGDPRVSRLHCAVRLIEDQYVLSDEGSRTGTYLNGARVVEPTPLTFGDRLRVGSAAVIFAPGSEARRDPSARRLSDYVMLQEITKGLNTETDLDPLLALIMDTAIHLTRAERGFLITVEDGSKLKFRVSRNIDYGVVDTPEFKISNSVIRRVVKTAEPTLTSNAQQDLAGIQSIEAAAVRGVMCVPLRSKSTVLGTLYLDTQSLDSLFDQEGLNLLMAFSDQAAIAFENARLLQEARDKEAILSELRVASRIQQELLPKRDPELPSLEIAGHMKTAREVGGDYYDFIWGPQTAPGHQNMYVAIGDVSGKGVPAGLVMVMARSVLRSLAGRGASPRDLLREGNRLIKQDLKPGMFMSLLLTYVEVSSGRMILAGCGHERPLIFRAAERKVEKLDLGGLVLGVVDDLGPHIEEARLDLAPGDQILLYTDGVTEATGPGHAMFGAERLTAFLESHGHLHPSLLTEALLAELEEHVQGEEQHDDITLIAIRKPT